MIAVAHNSKGRFAPTGINRSRIALFVIGGLILAAIVAWARWASFAGDPAPAISLSIPKDQTGIGGVRSSPLGEGMGIQVQPWYLNSSDLAGIAGAGFRVVRWGVTWAQIEKTEGVYDWSQMDGFMAALSAARLRSVIILGYGNPLYPGSGTLPTKNGVSKYLDPRPPVTPRSRAAFARFAAAAAERYQTKNVVWEIWNEPDSAAFWWPKPDPDAYAKLALQSCAAIRAISPKAQVYGGVGAALPNAVARQPNIYGSLMKNGAMKCLDGVSAHAYRMTSDYHQPDPESITADIAASRSYLYSQLKMPPQKRLIVTEWGFTTANISNNLQAAYLLRANLVNIAVGIPLTVWYEWRDSRPDRADPESHFGLLTTYGGPKNTFDVHHVSARISGARFVGTLKTNRSDGFALRFRDDASEFLVAWIRTSDEAKRSKLFLNRKVRADVSFMPVIVDLGQEKLESIKIE